MKKTVLLLAALMIAGLGFATGAEAYTYKFRNATSSEDGVPINFKYYIYTIFVDRNYQANDGNPIYPGQSWSRKHGGGEAGFCLGAVWYQINKELPNCSGGNLAGKWFEKKGLWCGNKTIVVYRDGCNLKIDLK